MQPTRGNAYGSENRDRVCALWPPGGRSRSVGRAVHASAPWPPIPVPRRARTNPTARSSRLPAFPRPCSRAARTAAPGLGVSRGATANGTKPSKIWPGGGWTLTLPRPASSPLHRWRRTAAARPRATPKHVPAFQLTSNVSPTQIQKRAATPRRASPRHATHAWHPHHPTACLSGTQPALPASQQTPHAPAPAPPRPERVPMLSRPSTGSARHEPAAFQAVHPSAPFWRPPRSPTAHA